MITNSLSHLSSADLIQNLRKLISQERDVLTQILWHLREVEFRKLFAEAGYPSLFEYAVKELGYSESSAFRRISSMRLLKSLPASEVKTVEVAIQSGSLNLSKLTQAQAYFKHKEKMGIELDSSTKTKVISDLESKSVRECERYFSLLAPEILPQEKVRTLTEAKSEIKIIVSNNLLEKIKRSKTLQSHVNHEASLAEVLEMALDIAIKKKESKSDSLPTSKVKPNISAVDRNFLKVKSGSSLNQRHIPSKIRKFIWNRDQGECTYQNKKTGRICASTYQIEIDHIHPIVLNGDADPKNLRLLCKTHNAFVAKKIFAKPRRPLV